MFYQWYFHSVVSSVVDLLVGNVVGIVVINHISYTAEKATFNERVNPSHVATRQITIIHYQKSGHEKRAVRSSRWWQLVFQSDQSWQLLLDHALYQSRNRKRREVTLCKHPESSLKEARDKAHDWRKKINDGEDPYTNARKKGKQP